jgi:hypothetical protein
MQLKCDRDVQAVLEFMQSSIPASKLVMVADAVSRIAPILWSAGGETSVQPLTLSNEQLIRDMSMSNN